MSKPYDPADPDRSYQSIRAELQRKYECDHLPKILCQRPPHLLTAKERIYLQHYQRIMEVDICVLTTGFIAIGSLLT
jgi:hypothetical protein